MKSYKDFVASKVVGMNDDLLLANHPNNPAMQHVGVPFYGDKQPIRNYIYDGGNGSFYLIEEHPVGDAPGESYFAYEWTHPIDTIASTLREAEFRLYETIRGELPASINEVEFTKEQVMAIYDRWTMRGNNEGHMSFVDFIATAKPTFGMDNAVTIPWCGMLLAIETDGFTHS